MDDIGRLLLFRDVVELGSFSRAARQRGLNHSTVSRHLRSLEQSLGVTLLLRTSRSMSLTAEGRVALDTARRIGGAVQGLTETLATLRGEVRGHLRVQSLVHLGPRLVQPALQRLIERHPALTVELILDDGPLRFSERGLDVAVRVGLEAEGGLTARKVMTNEVCIVAAPALLARLGPITGPEQLSTAPCVAYKAGAVEITRWRVAVEGDIRSIQVRPVAFFNDGRALLQAARDGLGLAYVSRFAATAALDRGELVEPLPDAVLPPYAPIYALYGATGRPRRVDVFLATLAEVAAGLEHDQVGTSHD